MPLLSEKKSRLRLANGSPDWELADAKYAEDAEARKQIGCLPKLG